VDIRVERVTPDDLSGKKRVWFRGIFHLIGILGESPFVSKLRKAESAQHSVLHEHQDNNAVDRWVCAAFSGVFVA
jgi:hypothetical protein